MLGNGIESVVSRFQHGCDGVKAFAENGFINGFPLELLESQVEQGVGYPQVLGDILHTDIPKSVLVDVRQRLLDEQSGLRQGTCRVPKHDLADADEMARASLLPCELWVVEHLAKDFGCKPSLAYEVWLDG